VLNVYRRQLSQGKLHQASAGEVDSAESDSSTTSTKSKNHSIMEKVAESVLKKITNVDPDSGFNQEMIQHTQNVDEADHTERKENQFTFNTIASNDQKETRSIAVDNSQILMSRLDELAKAAIKHNNEKNK
jgi:hypothetical protein